MITCSPCTPVSHAHDFDLTWVGVLIALSVVAIILIFVVGAFMLRHKENKVIKSDRPEDAYVTIGNIRLRKSTLHIAGSAWLLGHSAPHDVLPHHDSPPTDAADAVYGIHHEEM